MKIVCVRVDKAWRNTACVCVCVCMRADKMIVSGLTKWRRSNGFSYFASGTRFLLLCFTCLTPQRSTRLRPTNTRRAKNSSQETARTTRHLPNVYIVEQQDVMSALCTILQWHVHAEAPMLDTQLLSLLFPGIVMTISLLAKNCLTAAGCCHRTSVARLSPRSGRPATISPSVHLKYV